MWAPSRIAGGSAVLGTRRRLGAGRDHQLRRRTPWTYKAGHGRAPGQLNPLHPGSRGEPGPEHGRRASDCHVLQSSMSMACYHQVHREQRLELPDASGSRVRRQEDSYLNVPINPSQPKDQSPVLRTPLPGPLSRNLRARRGRPLAPGAQVTRYAPGSSSIGRREARSPRRRQ